MNQSGEYHFGYFQHVLEAVQGFWFAWQKLLRTEDAYSLLAAEETLKGRS